MRGSAAFADLLVFTCLVSIALTVLVQEPAGLTDVEFWEHGKTQDALLLIHTADASPVQVERSWGTVSLHVGRTLAELCEDAAVLRHSSENLERVLKNRIREWFSRIFGPALKYRLEISIPELHWTLELTDGSGSRRLLVRELRFPPLRFPSRELLLRLEVWA